MIGWLFQHLQFARKAFSRRGVSARQLALGVAFGLVLGLIPKGNLIAVALSVVILASTVNVGVAMITAALTSFAAFAIDPISHRIGHAILTHESLQGLCVRLYETPLVPWTDFNNTVVTGGLVLGLAAFYPVYRLSYAAFQRYWLKSENAANASEPKPEAAASPEATSDAPGTAGQQVASVGEQPGVDPSETQADEPAVDSPQQSPAPVMESRLKIASPPAQDAATDQEATARTRWPPKKFQTKLAQRDAQAEAQRALSEAWHRAA